MTATMSMCNGNHRKGCSMEHYRQGDVVLVPCEIPVDAALKPRRRVVVAEGEVTGHAHVIESPAEGEVLTDTDAEFIRIMGANGLLKHDEHTAIELPPGDYRRVIQREYSLEETRLVAD